MTLDERLRDAFAAKAATASPSPEAWDLIRSRTRRNPRVRFLQAAAVAVAVPALAVGAVLAITHSTGRAPGPAVTVTPTPSTVPVVTGTASPTPSATGPTAVPTSPAPVTSAPVTSAPAPSGPAVGAYADAIAVGHDGGRIDIVSPTGELLATPATLKGLNILKLAWTPDRTLLYAAAVDPADTCAIRAVAIQVATKNVTELGPWRDFAFSPDGAQTAWIEQDANCGKQTIRVQSNLTDSEPHVWPVGTGEWDNIGNLQWVPGANRLIFIGYGPGDGNSVLLLDLDKDTTLDQAAPIDGLTVTGELPDALTYLGNRLVVSDGCCFPTFTEHVRLVQRDGATGKVTTLLKQQGWGGAGVAPSPDGKSLLLTPWGTEKLYTWDQKSAPHLLPIDGRVAAW